MNFEVPFGGRPLVYTREEIDAVVELLEGQEPLTQGRHLNEFEKKLSQFLGGASVFAVNNATSALELAATLCQLTEGDEVILPSHTFTSSAYPFARTGARLVWVDIDPTTRVVCRKLIEPCLTSRTKVIVVPHLYGYAADMSTIMDLARGENLLVVEDAAQALGAKVNNQHAGTFGDFGVFSFHGQKNITTLGEGGALVVKSSQFSALVPTLRHNGSCSYPDTRSEYWKPAMGNVDLPSLRGESVWPINACIGEVECAIGSKLVERVDEINKKRRQRAIEFIDALDDCPELSFHREASERHVYHLLVAKIVEGMRDVFIDRMARFHKIQCVVQYYPLNRYPFYQKLGFGDANCPNADNFFDNMVSFPFHLSLSDLDLKRIEEASRETICFLRSQ